MRKTIVNMDKKEYLRNRLKRDFLQYSLLQDDSLPAKEIADKVYDVIDLGWMFGQGKQEAEALIARHLSFEKVKAGGKLSNELSKELDYALKDRIISEYNDYLDSCSSEKIITSVVSSIRRSVELQAWSNGIGNMQDAIGLLVEKINSISRSFVNVCACPVSEDGLLEKFSEAKEITLLERIQGNNIDDIIEYRSALIEYVHVVCENLLYVKVKEIYSNIARNGIFDRLASNFNALASYAQELKSSIAGWEANEEWDREYNRLVPTDFYYRNVESITSEQAFQMVLLQFFASNEGWMIENGMLADRELCVYTGDRPLSLEKLLNAVEDSIVKNVS